MTKELRTLVLGCVAMAVCLGAAAKDTLTVAVLPFAEQGSGVKDQGPMVANLLFAELSGDPKLQLVERARLDEVLKSTSLNLSGLVDPSQAPRIGRLVGADLLITGTVFKSQDKTYLVAKVISAETSRVFGAGVAGVGDIGQLGKDLGKAVSKSIADNAAALSPKDVAADDAVAALRKIMGDDVPALTVYARVTERHVGQPTLDPAATTELIRILKALKFKVVESESESDIRLTGEAFSEFAGRRDDLVSVMGTVELKAVDRKGEILASDRQTETVVGLAEQTAGKEALQRAAARLAMRVVPLLPKK